MVGNHGGGIPDRGQIVGAVPVRQQFQVIDQPDQWQAAAVDAERIQTVLQLAEEGRPVKC
ncbi:MAG: hypothetical protein U5P41_11695 [Gammaproteobacteria bacterium]|nr:hypothetical protein [Gammaproteobacteria bacterium]